MSGHREAEDRPYEVSDRVTDRVEPKAANTAATRQDRASARRERRSSSPSRPPRRPTRLSASDLAQLAQSLASLDRQIVESVGRFRLLTGGQLRRLLFAEPEQTEATARRMRRRTSALTEHAALFRLSRRIGGERAGSDGQVFALGTVGARLLKYWGGDGAAKPRGTWEPSTGFVDHGVLVSEIVVRVVEAQRLRRPREPVEFAVERDAWRSFIGDSGEALTLKPDAELRIPDGEFEDCWLLEVDRATEHRSTVRRKLGLYRRYWSTGTEQRERGVFPLVAWITIDRLRAEVLREVIAELPEELRSIFRVAVVEDAVGLFVRSKP